MRLDRLGVLVLCLLTTAAPAVGGPDAGGSVKKKPDAPAAPASRGRGETNQPEFALRERAALEFVKEHQPELARVVEPLRDMRPVEYRRAIQDLYQVSQNLTRLRQNDPRRYEVGLGAWKARSRVEVLTAKLAGDPSPELEAKLREAVAREFDANLRRQKLEREIVRSRLKTLDEAIEKAERNRGRSVEAKYQYLFRKSQEAGNVDPAARKKGKGTK